MANSPKSPSKSRRYTLNKFGVSSQLEKITRKESQEIAIHDAPVMSSNADKYVSSNWRTYYILCNLYVHQAAEVSVEAAIELGNALRMFGLVKVIDDFNALAKSLIQTGTLGDGHPEYAVSIAECILSKKEPTAMGLRETLQFLRFAKRFSPDASDRVEDASIKKFSDVNKSRNYEVQDGKRSLNLVRRPLWLVQTVGEIISKVVAGYKPAELGTISNGKAADAERPLCKKLLAISYYLPAWADTPLYPTDNYSFLKESPNYVTIEAVPKSYDAARLIAPETVYHQYEMQRIRIGLYDAIKKNGFADTILREDQSVQWERARIGSIDGSFATIDLTAASDSIGSFFASEVLPTPVWEDVMAVRSYYVMINKQKHRLDTFLTSGSGCTFALETIIFWAIAKAATDYVATFVDAQEPRLEQPTAYGDDTVVDSRVAATYIDFLEMLGFTVNMTKTFTNSEHHYRESCGSEFVRGEDISSAYWPRTTYKWACDNDVAKALGSLVQLQHNLFSRSTYSHYFLAEVVRSVEPRMTSHVPGTDCADLWEKIPRFSKGEAPRKRWYLRPSADGRSGKAKSERVQIACELDEWVYTREKHLHLGSQYVLPKTDDVPYEVLQRWEMWKYVNFLSHGPAYNDELDRLLNVTDEGSVFSMGLVQPDMNWILVTE